MTIPGFGEAIFASGPAQWIEALGFAAAGLTLTTYCMKTMIPLRAMSICASTLFIAYGLLAPSYPQLVLHGTLLPLNLLRLLQMRRLIDEVKHASSGDLSMDWLGAYSATRDCRKGEVIFRKGDGAESMFYSVSGSYLLDEISVKVGPDNLIGEIGMVSPDNRRTQTLKCIEAGKLLEISYDRVRQLYFQNPSFGFYFLNLISRRLITNTAMLEQQLARKDASRLAAGNVPAE